MTTETCTDADKPLAGSWLAWAWVAPQALLLWLNWRAWTLVRGDLSETQRFQATQLGLFEGLLLLLGLACATWCIKRRRSIGPWLALGTLGLHVGYLWVFLARLDKLIPRAVTLWMIPETELMFYQFSLIMPVIFLMLVGLACIKTGLSRGADIGLSVGLLVGIPAGAYIIGVALSRLIERTFFRWDSAQYFIIAGVIGATALILVAFLKLLIRLHAAISRRAWSAWVLPLAAGLVAPLAGMALNAHIPFPYDFQDPTVYTLTVVNGLALLIPFRAGSPWALRGWIVRAALFPFSLYFFLVFLPFLPLSLLAMIAAGAGFLILAPVFLLVIHVKLLVDQGRALAESHGSRRVAAWCAACLLVLPGAFVLRCEHDRRTLGHALDAVFSPDYRSATVDISPRSLTRALDHMDNVKHGIYLPYMTDAYSALVFHGMVLPDPKAALIRQSLLNPAPATKRHRNGLWNAGFLGSRRRGFRTARGGSATHGVEMAAPLVTSRTTDDMAEAEITLTLKNRGDGNGEFSTPIAVPEGVLVTGLWLDVGGTNKPAQIRERKTAIWVYEMIRDMTRRDPGLLVYESDRLLRLKVYPFDAGQQRTCGLNVRFPAALQPVITIGTVPVDLRSAPDATASPVATSLPDGSGALILPAASQSQWPTFTRTPVAHLILDRSAAAESGRAELIRRAQDAVAALPETVQQVRVTWANYEQEETTAQPEPRNSVTAALNRSAALPYRGGFIPELAVARILLKDHDQAVAAKKTRPAQVTTLFVVLPAPGSSPVSHAGLSAFARLLPDMPSYVIRDSNGWQQATWSGALTALPSPTAITPAPVTAIRKGSRVDILAAAHGGSLILGEPKSVHGDWELWDPASGTFRPLAGLTRCADPAYAAGLALWARHRALAWTPSDIDDALPGLVKDAQQAGVMIPETALVVLETRAQEVMLARKERQSLRASHALEFDEVPVTRAPSPPALWLLPAVLVWFLWHRRRTMATARVAVPARDRAGLGGGR